jgi:hypothetical protein
VLVEVIQRKSRIPEIAQANINMFTGPTRWAPIVETSRPRRERALRMERLGLFGYLEVSTHELRVRIKCAVLIYTVSNCVHYTVAQRRVSGKFF